MEGLIPLLIRAMKKQRPQQAYRCLSENSTGRSYHLLLADGSSHRRGRSDFNQTDAADYVTATENSAAASSNSNAGNGLRQRGFGAAAAAHYGQVAATRT